MHHRTTAFKQTSRIVSAGILGRWLLFGLMNAFLGDVWAVTPMVASGGSSSFSISSDGTLLGWGSDQYGQLGQGRLLQSNAPLEVGSGYLVSTPISGKKTIASGAGYTLAIKQDGTLWGWGENSLGQLGDGTNVTRSTSVLIGSNFRVVGASLSNSAGIKSDGSLWTWGGDSGITPSKVGTGYSSVALGWFHYAALKADGTLWTWGYNFDGQIGDGTKTRSVQPVQIGSDFQMVAAGLKQTFGLKQDGTLWGWGANDVGQLGDGTTTSRASPVMIGTGYSAIAAGNAHTLALKPDGSLWSWGWGSNKTPGQVGTGYVAISAGFYYSLALKGDGSLWAFGGNYYGQLGVGDTVDRGNPTQVGTGFVSFAAGNQLGFYYPHTLALKADGTLWSWGSNTNDQLGLQTKVVFNVPKVIGTGYSTVSASDFHTLALKADRSLWAWGDNLFGQLGDGSNTKTSLPKQIGADFIAISAAWSQSLGLKSDHSLWQWGYIAATNGSMGQNYFPTQVGTGFAAISAGYDANYAIKLDGSLWAWGLNESGQLGIGSSTGPDMCNNFPCSKSLVKVGDGFASVAACVGSCVFAVKSDGTLWAWGYNGEGVLGDGTTINRTAPVQIGTGFSAVATGMRGTIAIKRDGTVWTWGVNYEGQLGIGTNATKLTPTQVPNLTNVVGVTTSRGNHSLALKSDGTIVSFGSNVYGQLGDGTLVLSRRSPVLVTDEKATGPLDIIPEVANNIPLELIPPYWLKVTKAAEVSTAVTYNLEDRNKGGSVYVVAYLPTNSPLLTGANASGQSASIAKDTGCPASATGTVPAVLTRGGWKQTDCTTLTVPLYTGTLNTANNTFGMYDASKFDQTKDNGLFCVGYAGASTTSAKGLIRSVVSGVDANLNICPPIQIGAGASDTTAPSIPLNLTATAAGPGQVNLNWNAATDNTAIVRYNIYRGATQIAILENVTSFTDTSPLASTAYSYSVMACDAAANCSGQSTPAQTSTPAQPSVTLGAGWNLVGNGGSTVMSVPSLFGDASKIYSLWKWVKSGTAPNITYPNWAFYTPGQSDSGAVYAASMGYDTFNSIASGEGFWVNAKEPMSVPMTAPAWILSSVFAPNQNKALTPGWSLIATGEAQTASAFNKSIGSTPPTADVIPINLTSLWAWQNSTQRWYFYAPSLDATGGLSAYLSEMNYMDFGSLSFAPTIGLWVNRP